MPGLASIRQLFPEVVDFLLLLAVDEKGDPLRGAEPTAVIERDVLLARELECR
jgi:hypothetical protein